VPEDAGSPPPDVDDDVETREVFYTASGRKVYGGGGIRPDYVVPGAETPPILLRLVVFPLGRLFRVPPDEIGHAVARTLSGPGPARDRLTRGAYIPKDENEAVRVLETALVAVIAAEPIESKIQAALRAGSIAGRIQEEQTEAALAAGIIDAAEAQTLERAAELRRKVIMVDDFPLDLGQTEMHQTTEAVTYESLRRAVQ